ncbi:hypothetical protein FNV43_RR07894 [Rhamnella rubrinervis]|uniref:Uncharacterized protein n=1 Tax=Rhamnella rubrinervis TaxID=2594499 RepID=A0A8K0HHI6_9ROSA|nr:hypothetical protein FNV43_RR07894 [Rhamnella rubrinervis]
MAITYKALCMVALLVCSIFVAASNANTIHYGVMHKGDSPHCNGALGNKGCLPPREHPYDRGCEKEDKCRGGDRKL